MAERLPLSEVRRDQSVADRDGAVRVRRVRPADVGHGRHDLPGHADALADLVPRDVVGHQPEDWDQRPGLQQVLGLGSYETAWTWLHKLRRAMVRPGRDRLTGTVEVDETLLGGVEEWARGRQTAKKAMIAVAAEERGPGVGRIRLRRIPNATADSLQAFVQDAVAPGSLLHTDGLLSYDRLEKYGYRHRITFVKGRKE